MHPKPPTHPHKPTPEQVGFSIERAVRQEIERVVLEEAAEAAKRTEKRVRENVTQIAANVANHFSFERFGTELRISVKFQNGQSPS